MSRADEMRRHGLGVFALLFLTGAGVLYLRGVRDANTEVLLSVCMRVGLVLGAMWLALPQLKQVLQRFPPWLIACVGFSVLVIAVRPRAAIYVVPLLGVVAVLQFVGWLFKPLPKPKKQSSHRRTRS